jgi:DNA-binding MarR family transcriptional regulator
VSVVRTKDFLGFALVSLGHRIRRETEAALQPFGLLAREFGVLNEVICLPMRTQIEIGESLLIDRTTMYKIIDRLESLGYVIRREDARDRRIFRLEASEIGVTQCREAASAVMEVENEALAVLTADERQSLKSALTQILRH